MIIAFLLYFQLRSAIIRLSDDQFALILLQILPTHIVLMSLELLQIVFLLNVLLVLPSAGVLNYASPVLPPSSLMSSQY